jgi:hypothetical protein
MTSNEYTTRELNLHFAEIKETLARIEAQTTRTNGRVTECEKNISMVKNSGTVANWAFGLTIPLILGMAVWIFFNQIEDIRTDIHKHEVDYQKLLDKLK